MKRLSAKDYSFAVGTGLFTGIAAWRVLVFLDVSVLYGVPTVVLVVALPILWVLGVWLGYFLSRWIPFFEQFGRYSAVGFTNALMDFSILNILIAFIGLHADFSYSIFKGASFIGATATGYALNKYWSFEASRTHGGGSELTRYVIVAVIALVINDAVASFAHASGPFFGFTVEQWANLSAVAGSAVALIFSFIGYKMVVFKK